MNWKEILPTAIAVLVGVLLANVIAKKVPLFSQFEDSDWESDE